MGTLAVATPRAASATPPTSSEKTSNPPVRHCRKRVHSIAGRSISARAAICSTVLSVQALKPLSGAPKGAGLYGESADRAIMDVAEIGHCLRDRVPNLTRHHAAVGHNLRLILAWLGTLLRFIAEPSPSCPTQMGFLTRDYRASGCFKASRF